MDNIKEGLVIKAISSFFYIEYKNVVYECRSSSKLKKNKEKIVPGDIVLFDFENLYIKDIKPRVNKLIRPQIANIQNAILTFSLKEPKMNFGLLDRMIMIMEHNNLRTYILITKIDLLSDDEYKEVKEKINYYKEIGYKILNNNEVDTKEKLLQEIVSEQSYVITGQSGVGKSTYLNNIFEGLNLKTQEISMHLGRGKHTTRETTFYKLKDRTYLIDTPGFSSLDLDLTKEEIRDNFVDFFALSNGCKFNGCYHLNEPGCNVKKAIENNEILLSRYENYTKMMIGEK